jgi:hypothetical protein
MATKCSPTIGERLHHMRQAAYDASRFGGKAGSHGATADFHAKEAERALKSGNCTGAEKHLKDAEVALKRAWRAPTTPRKRRRR